MSFISHSVLVGWAPGPSVALCVRLCLTLVHFVWQGAAVAGLVALTLPLLRRARPLTRYYVLLAALAVMAACPAVTFLLLSGDTPAAPQAIESPSATDPAGVPSHPNLRGFAYGPPIQAAHSPRSPASPASGAATDGSRRSASKVDAGAGTTRPAAGGFAAANLICREHIRPYAPGATLAYLAGVALMLLRLGLALRGVQALRRSSLPVDDADLLTALSRQAARLGLSRPPPLAYCARALGPCVVGVLRPTILLPLSFASLASGLAPGEVEAILGHELAHVRRYDHVVNFLQRLIEAALFFHPAVWFVSNRLRAEREHCCDELAVAGAVAGDRPRDQTNETDESGPRLAYAQALLRAAELLGAGARPADRYPAVALAATGRPSGLRRRVARLLNGASADELRLGGGGAALVLVALIAGVMAACLPDGEAAPQAPSVPVTPPAAGPGAQPASRPAEAATRPATRPARNAPPVLLVTEGEMFLYRALDAIEARPAGGPPTMTPAEYEKQCEKLGPKAWEKYTVIVFDRYAPHEEPRCRGVMYIGTIGPGLSLKQVREPAGEGKKGRPRVLSQVHLKPPAGPHPLARALASSRANYDKVFAARAMDLERGPEWQVVLDGTGGPMLVAWRGPVPSRPGEQAGTQPATRPAQSPQARLVLAFPLEESNWPLKISFPQFLDQSIEWLANPSAPK